HVPRHALALDDPRRVRARADGAGGAMDARGTVRGAATAEAVALDHPLEAAPLGGSGHLHPAADLEEVHRHLVAHVRYGIPVADAELAQHLRSRGETRLGGVALLGLRGALALLLAEPELDGLVA